MGDRLPDRADMGTTIDRRPDRARGGFAMAWRLHRWITATRAPVPQEVRDRLIASIFERKAAVVFGFLTTALTAVAATVLLGESWPLFWLASEVVLFAARMRGLYSTAPAGSRERERCFAVLIVLGLLWCLTFGLGNFAAAASGNPLLMVMAAVNTAGVAGNIASRNAPTPRFGLIAMALASGPFALGLIQAGPPEMLFMLAIAPFWIAGMGFVLYQNHGLIVRMVVAEYENHRAARTDMLTDLPNRILLEERLGEMCRGNGFGQEAPFAVLCLDLDGFKDVNDSHGHAAGDLLLRAVAGRIRRAIRDQDTACRTGGDEFVVLLPDTSAAEAAFVASRIITSLSRPFDLDVGELVGIGASIGSVVAEAPCPAPNELLDSADRALYAAKAAGKGTHRASPTASVG
jgi:diguanylate cyclase (GGDEF)-like protein